MTDAKTAPAAPTTADVAAVFAGAALTPVLVIVAYAGVSTRLPVVYEPGFVVPLAVAASALGSWWVMRRRGGWNRQRLGFTRPRRSLWHLIWQIPLMIVASATFAVVTGRTFGLISTPIQDRDTTLMHISTPLPWILTALALVVAGPVLEEILFRRMLLDRLRASTPVWIAVPLCSAVFAILHVVPGAVLYAFGLGLTLALLRTWYRSLWPCVMAHMANNALVTGMTAAVLSS